MYCKSIEWLAGALNGRFCRLNAVNEDDVELSDIADTKQATYFRKECGKHYWHNNNGIIIIIIVT